jgi:hypothetical protein
MRPGEEVVEAEDADISIRGPNTKEQADYRRKLYIRNNPRIERGIVRVGFPAMRLVLK